MMMKQHKFSIVLFGILAFWGCSRENSRPAPGTVMPMIEQAKLDFIGYVTDSQLNLQSQISPFSRIFIARDTVAGTPVGAYLSGHQRNLFYTDKNGDLWELHSEDLGTRLSGYHLTTDSSVVIRYWQPLLKVATPDWTIQVDTSFTARNSSGQEQRIRFSHFGQARFEGWTDVFVQERRDQSYRCQCIFWPILKTTLINETSGDSLFISQGSARQMFEPELGAIKYTTDYQVHEFQKAPQFRQGTWELMAKYLP